MTALDPFVRFLDLIPEALDDPSISADELAGRAASSRFHFDRLVAAAAGAPGAFRRRLLLERAAYRLSVGGHKVLDVAVEAGYGSNEAFTRAFVRAYGSLLPHSGYRRLNHVWLVGEIIDKAATLDSEVLDRPIELSVQDLDDSPSLRMLCVLLVAQEERWLSVAGEGPVPDYGRTPTSTRSRLGSPSWSAVPVVRRTGDARRTARRHGRRHPL